MPSLCFYYDYEEIKREVNRILMSVSDTKDYDLKLMDLHASHTLGCAGDLNT